MILKDDFLARWVDHGAPGLDLLDVLPLVPAVVLVALGWWFSSQSARKRVA
jgi:hypothetical protein